MLYLALFVMVLIMSIFIKLYLYPDRNKVFMKWILQLYIEEKITLFIDIFLIVIYFCIYSKYSFSPLFFSNIILISILLVISIIDVKMKIIPNKLVLLGIVLGVIMMLLNHDISIIDGLLGCLICGGLIAITSIITKGSIGMGDANLFACIGMFLGLYTTLGILLTATILSGLASLFLLTIKKVDRKTTIPFAPYVFAATIFVMIFN